MRGNIYNQTFENLKTSKLLEHIKRKMSEIISKFKSLKRPSHFILYCITFMLYATAMAGVGPLIPYLSEHTGHKKT